MERQKTYRCQVCGKEKKQNDIVASDLIRDPVVDVIRKSVPEWRPDGYICTEDLNRFRVQYIEEMLEREKGELTSLEESVMQSMAEHDLLSKNINLEFDRHLTFGERVADRLADFAGSWTFILLFAGMLCVWIAVNTFVILTRPFDPFPFILLNLVLSCIAAIQAPVIIMSQNRQEARDRLRAEHDYQVNLKAELEIQHLHEKMDHLLLRQGQRLMEMQKIQVELMEEIAGQKPR
jgi:uncharacterized membrane protein